MGTDRKMSYIAVVLVVASLVIGCFSFFLDNFSGFSRDVGWGLAVVLALAAVVLSVLNKR